MVSARVIVSAMLAQWMLGVTGKNDRRILIDYIHGGLKWTWVRSLYGAKKRYFHWCGACASLALREAGVEHDPILYRFLASTERLYRRAKKYRVPIEQALPGDLVVVGPAGCKPAGTHIAVVVNREGGVFYTVEGNATGLTMHGVGYGVIKATRPLPAPHGPGLAHVCPLTGRKATHVAIHAYRFWEEP